MNEITNTDPILKTEVDPAATGETETGKKESLTDRLNILLPQKKTTSSENIVIINPIPVTIHLLWIVILSVAGLLLFLVSLNTLFLSDRIVWNTRIGSVNVGGKTVSDAREALNERIQSFLNEELPVNTEKKTYLILHSSVGPVYDLDQALEAAYQAGHGSSFWKNMTARCLSFFRPQEVPVNAWFNEEKLRQSVIGIIPEYRDHQPADSRVTLKGSRFIAEPGTEGTGFEDEPLFRAYRAILSEQHNREIRLKTIRRMPDIDLVMAEKAAKIANNVVRRFLVMRYSYDGYNFDSWTLSLREVRDWFEFKKEKEYNNHNLYVVLNNDKIRKHISRRIAPYMYIAKEDIAVRSVDGKPVIDGVAKDGYYLDLRRSVKSINDCISFERIDTSGNLIVWLDVAHLIGGVANPDNEFGISDVLATGVTDFFGSPENRKYNIKHSSPRFQNVILHPGERFSFIRQMGKVDSANGFMKELVIVDGDSTEPQYGGGLCQVSSTLFRTIFFAGLPVISRVSHSFEVKYYRPAGLDATIFDPYPNLVFENDTKNLLLIQNYVDLNRTKMYFKFFGKHDGRRLRFEGPVVKDSVGLKKEQYRVTWYRHIEFPDGTTRTDKFNSVYLNRDLVKKYQPENLFMQKDSVFVPVAYDSTKQTERKTGPEENKTNEEEIKSNANEDHSSTGERNPSTD